MRYFTDSRFERLMMQPPAEFSRESEAYWQRMKRTREKQNKSKGTAGKTAVLFLFPDKKQEDEL